MNELSHTNNEGKARMVDVGNKPDQSRTASAEGFISLKPATVNLIRENQIKKGDVISVARIAGIQAAKKTADIIPLCHPLFLSQVDIEDYLEEDGVRIIATVKTIGKTGVEMEALHAVCSALLTVYDMCKAVDKEMVIGGITLLSKTKE